MPTQQQVAEFLDKLNDDDDFRYNLVHNTADVLDEYDITYDPDDILPPSQITIPPKGEVDANYDYYRDTLFPNNVFATNDNQWDLPPPPAAE
jgi:hypothetical protein